MTVSRKPNLISKLIKLGVILSLLASVYGVLQSDGWQVHPVEAGWLGGALLLTEASFILGALLMASSAGECVLRQKGVRQSCLSLVRLKHDARRLAQRLLRSRLFALGFWLNWFGAAGTSIILALAAVRFAPPGGVSLPLLAIIAIDLLATFGWRTALEIKRRRARNDEPDNGAASTASRSARLRSAARGALV